MDICDARLSMLTGNFRSAVDLLGGFPASGPLAKNNFSNDLQCLEMAYCSSQLGNLVLAAELFQEISDHNYSGLDVDDRLAAAWMERELTLKGSDQVSIQAATNRLDRLRNEYQEAVQVLSKAVDDFRIQ